jgi:hypothetical protein
LGETAVSIVVSKGCYDSGDIQEQEFSDLIAKCEEIGRMLGSMMRKAESFASSDYKLKDDAPPYLADEPATTDH